MDRTKGRIPTLEKLSESDLALTDPNEDIRDRRVVDRNGEEIGTIDDLFVDADAMKVRFILVASGGVLGIGEKKFLLPVDALADVDEDVVHVDLTRERAAQAPAYDPDLALAPDYDDLYGWYGYAPYWTPGYVYPPYPYYRPR